jgi:hypothetical protein
MALRFRELVCYEDAGVKPNDLSLGVGLLWNLLWNLRNHEQRGRDSHSMNKAFAWNDNEAVGGVDIGRE